MGRSRLRDPPCRGVPEPAVGPDVLRKFFGNTHIYKTTSIIGRFIPVHGLAWSDGSKRAIRRTGGDLPLVQRRVRVREPVVGVRGLRTRPEPRRGLNQGRSAHSPRTRGPYVVSRGPGRGDGLTTGDRGSLEFFPDDEPRAHKKTRTVENQGLRGSGAFTLPMRTGTPTSTSVDVCPRCGGVLTREHRSWTCEDCRFVPNHGAD